VFGDSPPQGWLFAWVRICWSFGLNPPQVAFLFDPYYNFIGKEFNQRSPMTTEATLTSKGQTTIPKEIRDSLRMKAGDRMTFTLMPDGTVVMRVKTRRFNDLAGMLYQEGQAAVPIEQLSI
jgi:antitoxin PrlF